MGEAAGQAHAGLGGAAGAVVVAALPVRVGLDRGDLGALGADLIGGRPRPDREHQSGANPFGIADHPLQGTRTAHRTADDGGHLVDAQRRERGNVGGHLIANGDERKP